MNDTTSVKSGVWLNKRGIAFIELGFLHELVPIPEGWRITAQDSGRLTIHLPDGRQQKYDLAAGDSLSTAGDEMYLVLDATLAGGMESKDS